MARNSTKNNRRRGKKIVRRASSHRADKLKFGLSAIAVKSKFDFKKTITENYAKAGYIDSMNRDCKIQESKVARLIPGAATEQMEYVNIDDLPDIRIASKIKSMGSKNKRQKGVSPDERAYLEALCAKHGEDAKAMEKDSKLNTLQWSAKVIKTKLAKMPKTPADEDDMDS
jgi:hypothetical protein